MFKTKKAKIVSQNAPVLEAPLVAKKQGLVGIDRIEVEGSLSFMTYGKLTDYSGQEYDFEWDNSSGRLARLVGSQVTPTVWRDAVEILNNEFLPKEEKLEIEDIEISVEDAIQKALEPIMQKLQILESKIENIKVEIPKPVTAPITRQVEERPVVIEQPSSESGPEDFSMNALKFLQESGQDDSNIDYLSL